MDLTKNKRALELLSQDLVLRAALGTANQSRPHYLQNSSALVTHHGSLRVLRYLNHVRAAMPQDTAGGYTSALACHRAIQDALSGLLLLQG